MYKNPYSNNYNSNSVFDPKPNPGYWAGLSYLTAHVIYHTKDNFDLALQNVIAARSLRAHINYLNTCPSAQHPIGYAIIPSALSNSPIGIPHARELCILISNGLDLMRDLDGTPAYLVYLESVKTVWDAKAKLLHTFLDTKRSDPQFTQIFIKAFQAWSCDRKCERRTIVAAFMEEFEKLSTPQRSSVLAGLKEQSNFSPLVLLFNTRLDRDTLKNETLLSALRDWAALKNSTLVRDRVHLILDCVSDSLLIEVFSQALNKGELEFAAMVLGHLKGPCTRQSSNKINAVLIPLIQNLVPQKLPKNKDTDYWISLYLQALRLSLESNKRLDPDSYEALLQAFQHLGLLLGLLSADQVAVHKQPVFEGIATGLFHPYPIELNTALGLMIMSKDWKGPSDEFFSLLVFSVRYPKLIDSFFKDLHLNEISLCERGGSVAQWVELSQRVVKNSEKSYLPAFNTAGLPEFKPTPKNTVGLLDYLNRDSMKFICVYGRTLVFRKEKSNEWFAVKLQKTGEESGALARQRDMQVWLTENKERLGLQSDYPTPLYCGQGSQVIALLDACLKDSPNTRKWIHESFIPAKVDELEVLIYKAKPEYFQYLHEILDPRTMRASSLRCIHDLSVLLKEGIYFDSLADLFHDVGKRMLERSDAGRYIVLFDLVSNEMSWSGEGSGHLEGWLSAIEYANLTKTGLRDEGDMKFLHSDVLPPGSAFRQKFVRWPKDQNIEMSIFLNAIAEYLYVMALCIGRRARLDSMGKQPEAVFPNWKTQADLIVDLCAHATHIFSGEDEAKLREFFLCSIDLDRLARQMQFWMTKEHIHYVKSSKIPDKIYGPKTTVTLDFDRVRKEHFNNHYGCCNNTAYGPDLGPDNGQEPIKELNKLLYLVAMTVHSYSGNQKIVSAEHPDKKMKISS